MNASTRSVLGTPDGRRVVAFLVEDLLAIRGASFQGNALDTAFREGVRAAARQVEQFCKAAFPEAYQAALIERLQETATLDRPQEKSDE